MAPELSFEDRLHQRAKEQAVAGRKEVDRPAHDPNPDNLAPLEELRERLRPEACEPRPECGVRVVRHLRLQPDQVTDRVEDR